MSLVKRIQFLVVIAALLLSATAMNAALSLGDSIPDLSAYELEGELPDLEGKVVLIDVWASWCAPCKASFPAFDAMHEAKVSEGLVILAVSVDRKAKASESFLKRLRPKFATVRDGNQKLVAELNPPAMPTSFIFGRDGKLRSVHRGFHGDDTIEELSSEIETLLKE
jgi:thiol-disulfide isomerase/thioredoxin